MNQEETIGPINIGNPYEMTIKELAIKCLGIIKTKSKKHPVQDSNLRPSAP